MLRQRLNRSRARNKRGTVGGKIDMTPILDMTFLLLIAFIITFPALQSGINVQLPTAKGDPLQNAVEPLTITVRADGHLFLGKEEVTDEVLEEEVRKAIAKNKDTAAHIRGDESQSYGRIIDILKILRRANLTKFSLVTETE